MSLWKSDRRSLSGFMRKINRDVKVVNIDKLEDFEKYVNR